MKQLSQNKKSWFNQDIFKEINLSIDEYYKDKVTKKEVQDKEDNIQIKKSNSNLKKDNKNSNLKEKIENNKNKLNKISNKIEESSSISKPGNESDSLEDDDDDDHYETQYDQPIIEKIKANKNLKENLC